MNSSEVNMQHPPENEVNEMPYIEKRGIRQDRRIRDERRTGINPFYMGEVRRFLIDRRIGYIDRRESQQKLQNRAVTST